MYNYRTSEEEKFFEELRFDDENIPTFKQLIGLKGTPVYTELLTYKTEDGKLSERGWNYLKKIIFFQDDGKPIKNLRRQAFLNQPKFFEYYNQGVIKTFEEFYVGDENLIDILKRTNISTYSSMYEYFKKGEHIGTCGFTSQLLGSAFKNPKFHMRERAPFLDGTKGCSEKNDYSHAWLEIEENGEDYYIDTSIMMCIPKTIAAELGYEDKTKAATTEEMLEYHDSMRDDIYWEQYNITVKRDCKNKASYDCYKRYLRQLEEKKKLGPR